MKNFFKKQREIIALLLYVAVVAVLVYFVILPLMGRIDDINNQIQEEAANQESMKEQISQLPKIQQQFESLEDDVDMVNVLLEKSKAVAAIEKLEKMAELTNNKIVIAVQDVAPDPNAAKKVSTTKAKVAEEESLMTDLPSPDYLQMKISITGNYNSVVNFVKSLEKFEYYCDIVEIQIGKVDPSTEKTQAAATIGTLNPFDASNKKVDVGNIEKERSDLLEASLSTVFYLNKSN